MCGKDRSAWSRPVSPDVLDYVKRLCSTIRQSGDPAHGLWLLPKKEDMVRCWVDASELAEGVVLTSEQDDILADGTWLASPSDSTSTQKPSTHINVRELDVIIKGIEYLILYGYQKATIMSDSKSAVTWLSKTLNHQKVIAKGLHRFLIDRRLSLVRSLIHEYSLVLSVQWVYTDRNIADRLTRLPKPLAGMSSRLCGATINCSLGGEGLKVKLQWWPSQNDLIEAQTAEKEADGLPPNLTVINNIWLHDGVIYLPKSLWTRVVMSLHVGLLHPGRFATASTLKQYFWFPNMDREVERIIESCSDVVCRREREKPLALDTGSCRRLATGPWICVGTDITYIQSTPVLSCICEFSRYGFARVLNGETAEHIYRALLDIFNYPGVGFPVYLRCDRAPSFLALRPILQSRGTTLVPSSGHRGSANGVCERFHSTLKRRLLFAPTGWSLQDRLILVCDAYNNTVHSSTQQSPVECLFNRRPRLGVEASQSVPRPEGVSPFKEGQRVWVFKPREQRRAGARFLPGVYKITHTTPFASRVRNVDHSSQAELVVTNDRIIVKSIDDENPDPEYLVIDNSSVDLSSECDSIHSVEMPNEADDQQLGMPFVPMEDDADSSPISSVQSEEDIPGVMPRRHRRPPERFSPGGDPRVVSFDAAGYPI